MSCRIQSYAVLFVLSLMFWTDSLAQVTHTPSRERVDPTLRRRIEIDGNNVRTSVFNFAFSGRTGGGAGVPYEWPKNTNRYYVAIVALFVGAEVRDDTGGTQRIVDLPAYRTDARTGRDWNLNPIGVPYPYFNLATGKIAKSDEPETWPEFWPDKLSDPQDPGWRGKWNGFFGKNQFNADQEVYARLGDDNYNRYLYTPDTTDPSRRGLGLIIDYRALEWSQASVADAVFFIHEVKNDGTKDLKKAGVTLWLADFVGGDGDSQDDRPDFDLIQDIAFSFDYDGVSSNNAFLGECVGCAATLYLETPGNAEDRIDNDGESPEFDNGPRIDTTMLQAAGSFPPEVSGNQIDENHNGLIDEDKTHVPFGQQRGVGFADGIDNNNNGELGSPVVTQAMIDSAQNDTWRRWPPGPETDVAFWPGNNTNFNQQSISLIQVRSDDLGNRFKDNIDNDGDCPDNLPIVSQAMINQAASDPYKRYKVPGTSIVLYDLGMEDLDKKYVNQDRYVDAHIDDGIDEMVDESRNDGVDNDHDWSLLTDDVGLDGAAGTLDPGEGDGKATSGVGTPFPGEPNIDKTDVSEADQVGLTNVQYLPAGAINFSQTADITFWGTFMLPGTFVDPNLIPVGESDLFVSSGIFPLRAGQIERISCAVVLGNAVTCPYIGDPDRGGAKSDALRKRGFAQLAYNEDYQFAQAPIEPHVTAVAGDRKVTLYWDDLAELSFDRFLSGITGADPRDFEGYKIFRATDPAFEDARVYRDGFGSPTPWLRPLATFDLRDGIRDFFPVLYNGVSYNMGSDNGLSHTWTDTTVQNGQKYYYAVRAYDKGWAPLNIIPSESNLKVSIDNVTGKVTKIGKSIAIVTPDAAAGGYLPPTVSTIGLVAGSTTSKFGYRIVDPVQVKGGHKYRITFEDTITAGRSGAADTFKTKSYTLTDVTSTRDTILIDRRRAVRDADEQPVADGLQLFLQNETRSGLDTQRTRINRSGAYRYGFTRHDPGFVFGQETPSDYWIVFGALGADTSTEFLIDDINLITTPAMPVNFTVRNAETNARVKFALYEPDPPTGTPGEFSAVYDPNYPGGSRSDKIIILEENGRDTLVTSWAFDALFDSSRTNYTTGDSVFLPTYKIFRSNDVFEFTTAAQKADLSKAKQELDKIKVVPNPYIGAATWEERNPFSTGRGPRSIHFNHLPQVCTIRIYTVSGELVATIEHNGALLDGSEEWNLLTRDNLSVSYGVYIYHVEAPGVGEKIGKFAVIK